MAATTSPPRTQIDVLVTPDCNMATTMAFTDPFRAANYLEGVTRFGWRFASVAGGAIRASNGAVLKTVPLGEAGASRADFLIVSSSWAPEAHVGAELLTALRRAARMGTTLGGLDTGAFILAHAGLLDGHRATVHYEHLDAFAELFPDVTATETLWVFDRARITCSGGVAATECALHILQSVAGSALANAAARYIFAPPVRDHGALQDPLDIEPLGATVPETVRRAIDCMEAHLETPLPISDLCRRIDVSHRQLNRLFKQYVRKTPTLYYRDIRLDRARGLVTQTHMPMAEISFASGFASQVHFSRAYKDRFGLAPSRDRIEGRIPFEFRAWPMHRRDG